ncbi:B-cell differentiation antigen CD72 isoform X1 [Dasypus novemcinctus]|uniref:B-cell differentiation antigen CD72 isoform X1 n=2 Tax=Dasypus novemcinctus TaxID=9361 RepID=UPI0026602707|nr:B-cell differentiation antigen CD72 isoform X3 [Dasypus novemcinctus]
MAEAITYADLRFVKAPLRKSNSNRLGQDPEADEDGEITYENVQMPSAPVGPPSSDAHGPGDKAGVKSEPPTKAWSSVTSSAAGRNFPSCAACTQYLLLGLLLTCLLLAVAAICLGVRFLQVSQQLQKMNRVLEATNSSLLQHLHLKITQLEQRERDLKESRRELAQSQEALQAEQEGHQAAEGQLQACQSTRERTEENLQLEKAQKNTLEQRLSRVHDKLKPLFTCTESCCPVGWISNKKRCFYFSSTKKSWEESQSHCKSLSSDLAKFEDRYYGYYGSSLHQLLMSASGVSDSYWINIKYTWSSSGGIDTQYPTCAKAVKKLWLQVQDEACRTLLPFICEMAAFRYPDEDYLL